MYKIESTISSSPSSEAELKYAAAYRKTDSGAVKRRLWHSQPNCHEGSAMIRCRSEPWMKRMSLSSKDLIWGSCNEKEEEFMDIRPKSPPLMGESDAVPLMKMAAALSSLPGNPTMPLIPNMNDFSPQNKWNLPRFRQDMIMDHMDVEFRMRDLQTTLQRSISSDSMPEEPTLQYSDSFIAAQEKIMFQIKRESVPSTPERRQGGGGWSPKRTAASPCISTAKSFSPSRMSSPKQCLPRYSREETLDSVGSKVLIHDEERVYRAMDQGTARIVQCVGCSKHMMATMDMELVYCPGCGTLTPFELGALPDRVFSGIESA